MLSKALGVTLTLVVSASVWLTLGAGFYQLVRESVARMRRPAEKRGRVVREGYTQRAV